MPLALNSVRDGGVGMRARRGEPDRWMGNTCGHSAAALPGPAGVVSVAPGCGLRSWGRLSKELPPAELPRVARFPDS